MISHLNYHHLRYFREVAQEGHLGRTAEKLNVSQSALSIQIKQLEESLGQALFERVSRRLVLTEAGRIALDHAERIFGAGDGLLATLNRTGAARAPLRVGAASTLSRNFQLQFLRPILTSGEWPFELVSGNTATLLEALEALALDVVLATNAPSDAALPAQKIAEQPVRLQGVPGRMAHASLADMLSAEPLILPSESVIRSGVEALCLRLGVEPRIAARVDDMAMVRLLAREGVGLALVPDVVVADELRAGILETAPFNLGISEPFYAVMQKRRYPHPALADLLDVSL